MTEPQLIAELQKNKRETLRLTLEKFQGPDLLNMRCWAENSDGSQIPTKSGLSIRVAMLAEFRRAIERAEQEARALGLLPSDGGQQ
jgi:hypothetical protein